MNRRLFFIITISVFSTLLAHSQKWQKIASCEWDHRMYAISFSWNGKGYVGFGHNYNSASCYKDIEAYDPIVNSWTQDAYLDVTGRTGAFSFCYRNLLFFGGGSDDSGKTAMTDFYCYHLGNSPVISYLRTCDTLKELPFGRAFGASAVVIDSLAYIAGGCVTDTCERDLWTYNVVSKEWKRLGPLPLSTQFGCAFALAGKVYYGGGNNNGGVATKDFWAYDPASKAWEKAKRLPGDSRTMGISVACNNTEGIFGLGFDVNRYFYQPVKLSRFGRYGFLKDNVMSGEEKYLLADLWKYNAKTDSWKKIRKFPSARRNAAAFVIGDYLYILTGNSFNNGGAYKLRIGQDN